MVVQYVTEGIRTGTGLSAGWSMTGRWSAGKTPGYMVCLLTGLMMAVMATPAMAQTGNELLRSGNKLYKEQQFDQAAAVYKKSLEKKPEDPVVQFNLGDAYFRSGEYGEASAAFDRLAENGAEPSFRQKALYNKGVSLSKQDKLEESIAAYKQALRLDPLDQDARINLQKALVELQKRRPPPPPEQTEAPPRRKEQQEKPSNPFTPRQVEQLLKALQQREQQVQQKMQQLKNRSAGKMEKDW